MVVPPARSVFEQFEQGGRLRRVHPGGRLVEQQQLRLRSQRAGDLQAALVAVGEVGGRPVGLLGDADEGQQRAGPRRGVALLLAAPSAGAECVAGQGTARRGCIPVMTFSSTLIPPNMRMFWKVRARPAAVR